MIYHMHDHVADNTEPYELESFKQKCIAVCWAIAAIVVFFLWILK